MRLRRYSYIWTVALVLLFGCTGSPPDIVEIKESIVFRYDVEHDAAFELLYLYALVADNDGIGDINELYIIHDDQSLFWKLTKDDWDMSTIDDAVWIGSHMLRLPQARTIPRGRYRIQVYDQGGEVAAREFTLLQNRTVEQGDIVFPTLDYRDGVLNLTSVYNDNIVKWYYYESNEVFEYSGGAGVIDLQQLAPHLDFTIDNGQPLTNRSAFYIYAFPPAATDDYYVLVGPVVI